MITIIINVLFLKRNNLNKFKPLKIVLNDSTILSYKVPVYFIHKQCANDP